MTRWDVAGTKSTEFKKVLDDQEYVEKDQGSEMLRTGQMICSAHSGQNQDRPWRETTPSSCPSIDHLRFTVRGDSPLGFLTLTWTYGTRIHRGVCVWKVWNWIKHGRSTIWEWSTHAAAWAARAKGIVPVRARDFKNNPLVRQVSGVLLLCSLARWPAFSLHSRPCIIRNLKSHLRLNTTLS